MKEAIVDVDNTICDFAPVFYEELSKINSDIPFFLNWNDWNFYDKYMKNEDFYMAAHRAQMRIMECAPIKYSNIFLKSLMNNYKVVIASHRKEESRDVLMQWMKKNDLIYDDIHISYDKTSIFNGVTGVVVDDSPHTLQFAHSKGIISTGLKQPWNKCLCGNGIYLGNTLLDILKYIDSASNQPITVNYL